MDGLTRQAKWNARGAAVVVALLVASAGAAAERSAARPVEQPSPDPGWIWWEAETPRTTNFPEGNPFAPQNEKAASALSGGRWIGASDPGKILFLEYQVSAPKGGAYAFFARKFWQHGPFRWRFDDQPWRVCPGDVALLDSVPLAKFVEVNWVRLGVVDLTSGLHRLRVELLDPKAPAAFDSFLLTLGTFAPRGKLKPNESYGSAPRGWFTFDPPPDPFDRAPLDLRSLNEAAAGDGGFIQTKGAAFVHQKTGQEVRFWGVNAGADLFGHDAASLDRFARRLAKRGVNLLRLHAPLWREDDISRVDDAKLAKLHTLVASLKRAGIYLALSCYYPVWLRPKGVRGLDGYDGDKNSFGVSFFSERFQALQKTWWRAALTTPNPETGLTLVADPTLAFVEVVNEDSLLFWTFQPYETVPAPQMEILERRFGQWLATRYGGLGAAFQRWGGGRVRGDDVAGGRAGIEGLWEIANQRNARARDTAEFLAGVQRSTFEQMSGYLKRELGFKGSVYGSNWITADAARLGPLDKWSNAAVDFLDRHGYYGGPHEGERADYMLSPGDKYDDASALRFQSKKGAPTFELPLWDRSYDGKPSTVSEINWSMPNRYRAELPLLAAAYGALQGTDAFMFYATSDVEAPTTLAKFTVADPSIMGQFPATAVLFREGLVREGRVVARVASPPSDLFTLEGLPAAIDPLASLVGRVAVDFPAARRAPQIERLDTFIDRGRQTARSVTGELQWDWKRGLVTIDAPAAQGVTGFLAGAGTVALGDVSIASPLPYGAVLVVALDRQPIRSSRRLLLQVMSEDANSGWTAPGAGMRRLVDPGGPPIVIRELAGRISFSRPDARALRVRPLDFNGYAVANTVVGDAASLTLLPTIPYYLIEKP